METFSALLAICAGNSSVPGEVPAQRPVTQSFDVFFDLRLNKWLSKQSWCWWFETLSCQLWPHCNVLDVYGSFTHIFRFTLPVKKSWIICITSVQTYHSLSQPSTNLECDSWEVVYYHRSSRDAVFVRTHSYMTTRFNKSRKFLSIIGFNHGRICHI